MNKYNKYLPITVHTLQGQKQLNTESELIDFTNEMNQVLNDYVPFETNVTVTPMQVIKMSKKINGI